MKICSSSLLSSFLSLGLYADLAKHASASSTVIMDERVRSLDVTPVLGKGYGIKSNSYHSICLKFATTTEPSYDYKYFFTDLTKTEDEDNESALSGEIAGSFGSSWIGASVNFGGETENETSTSSTKRTVATTMRIERYYNSIDERDSEFSSDAALLLERKDYVGFFKACGPNYIRSLRRAQEVTAMFTFETSSNVAASEMSMYLEAQIKGLWAEGSTSVRGSGSNNIEQTSQSLQIEIRGWGLGLDKDGSETLVAQSLEDYNKVMKFAYTSMTRGNDSSAETGMVYGMEVVPWVDNAVFQAAIHMTHQLTKAVDFNLIPDATGDDKTKCAQVDHEVDHVKKCCLKSEKKTMTVTGTEGAADQDVLICRPVRKVPIEVMKQNALTNAEFVTVMDSVLRSKMNTAFTLERCITSLKGIPSHYDKYLLKSADTVWDQTMEMKVTVKHLRDTLDPGGSMATLAVLNLEIEEYLEKFYTPCIAALFGANDYGADGNNDGHLQEHFMATSYREHEQCSHTTCLLPNHRWDRLEGGCKPSLLLGTPGVSAEEEQNETEKEKAARIAAGPPWMKDLVADASLTAGHCSEEYDVNTGSRKCKTTKEDYEGYLETISTVWGNAAAPLGVPIRLMETFCTPRLTGKVLK